MELKKKRTYNSKTLQVTPTKREQRISAGIIHYENSERKLGDGIGGMRGINKSWIKGIVQETPEKVWNEETQDFDEIQTIPNLNKECYYYDFADDPVRAGLKANELIRYIDYFNNRAYSTAFIPQCNSVDGQIVDNDIVYNNAFSTGQDLVLRPTNSSLQKLVRLRDYLIQDYTFDFEIIIENFTAKGLSIFRVDKTGQSETYSIDPASLFTTPKVFDNPNRITVIGKTENDGTIIKPPKAWYYKDGEAIAIDIQTELYGDAQNGKFYLRKYIPSAFLQDANGEVVYTDTETTINVNTNIYRLLSNSGTSYNDAQTLTTWNNIVQKASTSANFVGAQTSRSVGGFYDGVGAYGFDISGLSGVTVSGAILEITENTGGSYVSGDDFDGDPSGDDCYYASSLDSIDITNITAGDKANWQKRIISNAVDGTLTNGQVMTFSLDATGISELQTKIANSETDYGLIVATGFGINETTPNNTASGLQQFYYLYDHDGASPPQLVVTYDVGTVASVDVNDSYTSTLRRANNTSWVDVREGTVGTTEYDSTSSLQLTPYAYYNTPSGNDFAIYRSFVVFNISSFSTTDTLNNAVFYAKINDISSFVGGANHTNDRYLQLLAENLTTIEQGRTLDEYDEFSYTLHSGKKRHENYSANDWVAFQLNSTGLTSLQNAISNGDSYYGFVIGHGFDIENTNLNDRQRSGVQFYTPSDVGNEPYIEIDYTSGGSAGGGIAYVNNVGWANISHINGIAIANISKINNVSV